MAAELIGGSISHHGGEIVDTKGDEFFAVFGDAIKAVVATVETQRSLAAEPWPSDIVLKVRMGLHTGSAERVDGGFVGLDVHRAARIVSAAHGGQILVSRTTAALVQSDLPPEIALRDLGQHRLKDLARPDTIFQIEAPGLAASFPPPRTLDSHLNNLPIQSTPFVGREREIAMAKKLLGSTRLLTFTGTGGTGKTRLGLQIAADVLEQFADGVFFISLAAVTDPANAPGAIAYALSVHVQKGEEIVDALHRHLGPLQVMLVLDNFEQIVGAAPVVARLLESCSRLKVLVTSREPLRLSEEQEYPVPPLGLPELRQTDSADGFAACESVSLFVQRARAVDPGFHLTAGNLHAVAEICVRLDGLPLSIELAAARMKLFTPVALLDRFGERFRLLSSGRRDVPERQQTLRKAIDWSYDLLEEGEKQLFARLGVFSGGFTLEAAEAVCASETLSPMSLDIIDGIDSLLNKSILKRTEDSSSNGGRIGMLETVREYAVELLEGQPECSLVRNAHAQSFADLAERLYRATEPVDSTREDDLALVRQLGTEHENIVAALEWATTGGEVGVAFRLLGNAIVFFIDQGRMREAAFWVERLRGRDSGVNPVDRARVHFVSGTVARQTGDLGEAAAEFESAAKLAREGGDALFQATAVLWTLLVSSGADGEFAEAEQKARKTIEFLESVGIPWLTSAGYNHLGELYRLHGKYEEAIAEYEVALEIEGADRAHAAVDNLGFCQWRLGRIDAAEASFRRVLREERDGTRSPNAVSYSALGMACVSPDPARAAVLLAASDALLASTGAVRESPDQPEFDTRMEWVRSELDDESFERQSELGRCMSVDEALAYALGESAADEQDGQ